ncbi:MAG: EAL domain-containing protein [Alphaproteobacteria bacterium]|nr:EAL domain-containing protein [Alphaproteobacteria bacterium]
MARRTKNTSPHRASVALSRAAMISAVFIATIVLCLLSFISLELAALTFLLMAVGTLSYAERRRRGFWELAASSKFKTLKEGQDALAGQISQNTGGLGALRDEVEKVKNRLDQLKKIALAASAAPKKPQPKKPLLDKTLTADAALEPDFYDLSGDNSAPSSHTAALRKAPYIAPRALRPGQKNNKPGLSPLMPDAFAPEGDAPLYHAEENETTEHPEEELESFSDTIVRELLHVAVENKRVEVFVQPIVRLPQRQPRFYEIFARIRARPGQYIPAARYMKLAEQDNMHHDIDNLLLLHCLKTIQGSAAIERAAPFFLNITPGTLKNGAFMKQLLNFIARNRALAPRLIFELSQDQFAQMQGPALEIIRGLSRLGCSFSLDHAHDLDFDVAQLVNLKIRFIKIDAAILLAARSSEKEILRQERARRKLEANGIGVIAQRIEDEKQLRQLLDFDIHYGQGYLFGKPEPQGAYASRVRARRKGVLDNDLKSRA